MNADQKRIDDLLACAEPLVWIPTTEEEYALDLVRNAVMGAGRPLKLWSAVSGIADGLVAGPAEQQTEHAAAGMYAFAQVDVPTVCVAVDLTGYLNDERTLRATREAVRRAAELGGTVVLLDHREDLPAVLRAYAARVQLSLPGEDEIEEITVRTLRRIHKQSPIELSISKKDMATAVRNLRGLSRRQVERVVTEAASADRKFSADDIDHIVKRKRELVQSDGLLEFIKAPAAMDEIGGLSRLKKWLDERRSSLSDDAEKFGLTPPRGILMLGVQGGGKSLCAKAIATAWSRPLLRLDPGVLYDRYIGESERRLREALRQAEVMAPIVLWIDEIEKAFASAASRSIDGGLSQRMFGSLLTWLQEHTAPVFVAATANDVEALPPELLRKGRFDEVFFVDLPGEDVRRTIFAIHLKKRSRDPAAFDLPALAKTASGFSGAEIEQAVVSGLYAAYAKRKQLDTATLLEVVKTSPPLSVTMAERMNKLRAWAKDRCVAAD